MLFEIKDRVRTIEKYLVPLLRGLCNLRSTNKLLCSGIGQFNKLRSMKSFCFSSSVGWNLIILLVGPAVVLPPEAVVLPLIHFLMR